MASVTTVKFPDHVKLLLDDYSDGSGLSLNAIIVAAARQYLISNGWECPEAPPRGVAPPQAAPSLVPPQPAPLAVAAPKVEPRPESNPDPKPSVALKSTYPDSDPRSKLPLHMQQGRREHLPEPPPTGVPGQYWHKPAFPGYPWLLYDADENRVYRPEDDAIMLPKAPSTPKPRRSLDVPRYDDPAEMAKNHAKDIEDEIRSTMELFGCTREEANDPEWLARHDPFEKFVEDPRVGDEPEPQELIQ